MNPKIEERLINNIEKLEKYILGDLDFGKLDIQLISVINHGISPIHLRHVLQWIVDSKYRDLKERKP